MVSAITLFGMLDHPVITVLLLVLVLGFVVAVGFTVFALPLVIVHVVMAKLTRRGFLPEPLRCS